MNFEKIRRMIEKWRIKRWIEKKHKNGKKTEPLYSDIPEFLCMQNLEDLARRGVEKRYDKVTLEITEELENELSIIKNEGVARPFLVFNDVVDIVREAGIITHVSGAAQNSLVAHAIGLTDLDPIKYFAPIEHFGKAGADKNPLVFCLHVNAYKKTMKIIKNNYGGKSIRKDKWGDDVVVIDNNVVIYVIKMFTENGEY